MCINAPALLLQLQKSDMIRGRPEALLRPKPGRRGGKMSKIRIGGPNDRRPPPEGVSIAMKMNNSLASDQACNI
jgi:hypothetical protein